MLGEFPETSADMQFEPDRLSIGYRWGRRAVITGFLAFSAAILILGVFALLLLGVPIALITGLMEGSWQATERALTQLWRISPILLAAELAIAWVLVALFLILRRVLAKFGAAAV